MSRMLFALLLTVLLAACGGSEPSEPVAGDGGQGGAATPEDAVLRLVGALAEQDYAEASRLTVDGQMVLVALAEGVTLDEAALLLEEGDQAVGENFWDGFVGGLGEFLEAEPSEARLGETERLSVGGEEFARVEVMFPLDGARRRFVLREGNGWEIDVVATFASALAGKLTAAAEMLREQPEMAALRELMREQDASLQAVLADDELGPELRQAVVSALEAIRR